MSARSQPAVQNQPSAVRVAAGHGPCPSRGGGGPGPGRSSRLSPPQLHWQVEQSRSESGLPSHVYSPPAPRRAAPRRAAETLAMYSVLRPRAAEAARPDSDAAAPTRSRDGDSDVTVTSHRDGHKSRVTETRRRTQSPSPTRTRARAQARLPRAAAGPVTVIDHTVTIMKAGLRGPPSRPRHGLRVGTLAAATVTVEFRRDLPRTRRNHHDRRPSEDVCRPGPGPHPSPMMIDHDRTFSAPGRQSP